MSNSNKPPVSFNLFTYGTLMVRDVFEGFVKDKIGLKAVEAYPAILRDYTRKAVNGAMFPAIVPEKGSVVSGIVYMNVPLSALEAFDRYEGEGTLYHRRLRSAELQIGLEGRQGATVQVYEWARDEWALSSEDWVVPEKGLAVEKLAEV